MLKKILVQIVFLVCAFFMPFVGQAEARENADYWYIKDFQSEIRLNQDSSLDITEKITADCGSATGKHGIFRVLPKKFKTVGETFPLPIEIFGVTDFSGNDIEYAISEDKETLTLKIGSADIEVQGVNTYEIRYRVKNAVRFGNEKFDELYWNLSGNFWDIDIDNFKATVYFPKEVTKENSEVYYYTGQLDGTASDTENFRWTSANTLEFSYPKTMKPGEGVTASVSFPKNIFTELVLSPEEKGEMSLKAAAVGLFIIFFFPLLSFFLAFRLWRKHGRDPKFDKTIIPEFEIPEDLGPMAMGGLMKKGGFDNKFITAGIINLAASGYVKIEEIENKVLFVKSKDYRFIRTEKAVDNALSKSESMLLDKMFVGKKKDVLLSSLKNKFYVHIPQISKSVKNDLEEKGLIAKGVSYQVPMVIVGVFAMMFSFMLMALFWPLSLALFLSGLPILMFGMFMPKHTPAGAELDWRVKGFKLYMDTAEKYRAQFNEKEGLFEKLLPYAVLFGMTKEWLAKMKTIYGDDYFSAHQPAFLLSAGAISNFDSFASSLSAISTSISSHVSSSPSGSSGGGSSGGGGGGGGGGGW